MHRPEEVESGEHSSVTVYIVRGRKTKVVFVFQRICGILRDI
jgi:hypothetical protein